MILAYEQDVTNDVYFSLKVQMVQAKINLYLSLLVYSLISM